MVPFTLTIFLTLALHYVNTNKGYLDTFIAGEIAIVFGLIVYAVYRGTPLGAWSERPTGIVLAGIGTCFLYLFIVFLPRVGLRLPIPVGSSVLDFIRATLAVGGPILLYAYTDWLRERVRLGKYKRQRRRELRKRSGYR